ncbi:hypothetical protein M406DRAFT_332426 [Cryphonectria parasitica EP155]|uniref:Myb-like domain-containing protein n=1 Tax=Cryphonectria parasitica (strain ATCC 38755 / EP155) TaxID=660469 RepID=A0A9P4XZ44_CRYP1|nr:uncharacterized protein M406DRAFT_332426 [Cryphonectria parasitica EP155]KAF3763989.1 hypothetical protein M406DRAFT_332426 [Cryphonectria parasitica EP155]
MDLRSIAKTHHLHEISPEGWAYLVQRGQVDNRYTPISQGYRVIDEVADMPVGNIPTRWAISTSEVARNDISSSEDEARPQGKVKGKTKESPKRRAPRPALPMASSSNAREVRKIWTAEEERLLVRLRCEGLPYHVIAQKHLKRKLKACQLKFAKLKTVSPHKQLWEQAKAKRFEFGNQIDGEYEDEDDQEECEYDSGYGNGEDSDDGGVGGCSSHSGQGRDGQDGAQAALVR